MRFPDIADSLYYRAYLNGKENFLSLELMYFSVWLCSDDGIALV